jgi:hypothetical protein
MKKINLKLAALFALGLVGTTTLLTSCGSVSSKITSNMFNPADGNGDFASTKDGDGHYDLS